MNCYQFVSNMLKKIKFNHYHFILLWTLLNIFQISTTELTSDEGYYWFYASRLEWGYYDHPPLLALLIWMGRILFDGELGVRLFNVLLMSTGIFFLLKTCNLKELRFVYIILLAIPLLNYITVIAFPDSPLVAISGIALYAYKRFLDSNDLKSSLLLALSFVLMLYAKYHAVLFILFILLSNLKLLKNRYFYLIIILTGLAYLPHLWWQHSHGYPSFNFHIQGRSSPFKLSYLVDYLSQQIFVLGIGVIFIPFIKKPLDQFEKTLKYISLGTIIFFGLSSLRGFVHLHWTSIALFPILILSAKYYSNKKNNILFNITITPFIVLLILFRLYLSFKIFPVNNLSEYDYYHDRALWAEDIRAIAEERPVVFVTDNSGVREAPLYSFYSKGMGVALFPGEMKKSQYQIWNYEDSIQTKDVLLIKSEVFSGSSEQKTRMGKTIHFKKVDEFTSFNNIRIECDMQHAAITDSVVSIPLKIINHRSIPLYFNSNHRIYIQLEDELGKGTWRSLPLTELGMIEANENKNFNFTFDPEKIDSGKYEFLIGINDDITELSVNSHKYKLLIPDYHP